MRSSYYYLLLILALTACDENNPVAGDPAPEKPIVFQKVNADVSDIQIAREFSFDIHVDGTIDYEENYPYSFNGINLTFPFYKASYDAGGMPVISPRIHNSLMCRTHDCDSNEVIGSGAWYRYDVKPVQPSFVWKFITTDTRAGYEVVMNELPKEVKIISGTESLSTVSDNVVEFQHSGTDSLLFGLLIISKVNLTGVNHPALVLRQYHFPVASKDNRFIIPAELMERVHVSAADTAFINLISMKRVIKVIEDKKVAINYRKNHVYPIMIN